MALVNSIDEFPGDNEGDLQNETESSTFEEVAYSTQWKNRKICMRKIPEKPAEKNKIFFDIMQLLNRGSSLQCPPKLEISNEESQSHSDRSSSSRHTPLDSPPIDKNASPNILQSNRQPLNSYSSSKFTNTDDFIKKNVFFKKLKNPTINRTYGHSYFDVNSSSSLDSQNYSIESFFPKSSADSFLDHLESREEYGPSSEMPSKYKSFHRFHWSENIEYCSPWVRHRAKEIYNHVNGLFEAKKKKSEILENDTEKIRRDSKSAEQVGGEDGAETDDDDIAAYEIASKLCDTFLNQNVSENQCPNDERFKWTNLYQKLIQHGQL